MLFSEWKDAHTELWNYSCNLNDDKPIIFADE